MLKRHVADGQGNGLVLAPTSGAKTLVAIILLRTLLVEKKDAILTLPYIAIVEEKVKELQCFRSSHSRFGPSLQYSTKPFCE